MFLRYFLVTLVIVSFSNHSKAKEKETPVITQSRINSNVFKISHSGKIIKEDDLLNHCAKLTNENGFDYFIILSDASLDSMNIEKFNAKKNESNKLIKMYKKGTEPELSYEANIILNKKPLENKVSQVIIPSVPSNYATHNSEPSLIRNPNKYFHFGIGIGGVVSSKVNTSGDSEYKNTNFPGSVSSKIKTTSSKLSSSLFISPFVRYLPEKELGFISSFDYIFRQKDSEGYSLSSYIPKMSAAISFNPIYFFGGLNYSFYKVNNPYSLSDFKQLYPEVTSFKYSASGNVGYQLGFGVVINSNLSLEVEYSSLKLDEKLIVKSPDEQITIKGDNNINNYTIGLRLSF